MRSSARVFRWRLVPRALAIATLIAVSGSVASAQPAISGPQPGGRGVTKAPPLAKSVERLLSAEYLKEDERKNLRIFHGVWTESDLDSPERVARAALVAGDVDNLALKLDDIPAPDRAEAALLRGEYREALVTLDKAAKGNVDASVRASRIRCDTLQALGRFDDAAKVAKDATEKFTASKSRNPEDVVEAVRLWSALTRLRGPAVAGSGGEYHAMMQLLDDVHNRIDKAYWPAQLAQAELLYEKDNSPEAAQTLQEVLSLNPSCAKAWAMLAQMAVDSYNFGMLEPIANKLDILAGGGGGASERDGSVESPDGVSALAAIVRARAAIRQNDPDAADAALEPALRKYPKMRELVSVKCAAVALRYEPDQLKKALADFDQLVPGSPLGLMEVGKALSEARQYAEAAEYLSQASTRLPTWPEPVIELGLLEVQSGRIDRALTALQKAHDLDPFNIRAENSLKLVKELTEYSVIESDHFRFRFKPGVDGVLAREMIGPMERNYAIVTGSEAGGIDYHPKEKTTIDLMPDHKWFGVRIAGMPAIHTIAASTGSCIAMEAPREGRDHLGPYDWVRVLRHEFTHTVTLARTSNRIPHWFTEASAVYLEQSPRDYNTCQLLAGALSTDSLFDFTQINIAFVRPAKPTDRAQAYAQGHWMYEYIVIQWGKRAPLALMDLYGQGQREEAAFQSVLGISRDEFLEKFKVWARDQVRSWGMSLPEGAPTIHELLVAEALDDPTKQDEIDEHLRAIAQGIAEDFTGQSGLTEEQGEWELPLPEVTPDLVRKWLKKYPDHADVLELAVQYATKGGHDAGEGGGWSGPEAGANDIPDLLERYAKARPVDPLPHRLLAKMYLDGPSAAPEKAIPHLEFLDAREQYLPIYAAELAKRYSAAKDLDKAWVKAERATQISPYDPALRELAAAVAVKRNDLASAERHVSALVELEPSVAKHKERLDAIKRRRDSGKP